jgi:hypothetical protein
MRRTRIGRSPSPAAPWRFAVAAVLAWWGVLGLCPSAVQASVVDSVPGWTEQAPATHPPSVAGASMACDAATGTVVLFGGATEHTNFDETWTWG